jgi:hypothetical protein
LGDFPPNGRLFTLCSYLKITQIAHILGYVLYSKERGYALILTKNAFNKKGRARRARPTSTTAMVHMYM